jgi:hypothetical protein
MGWRLRFWRRARILPGVTVNLSKSGPSLSLGPRGSKVTIGHKGVRQTIGLPGTGLFATNHTPWESRDQKPFAVEDSVAESEREAEPAKLEAQSEAPHVRPSDQTRCDFCGAQAVRGQRCPMCNQDV